MSLFNYIYGTLNKYLIASYLMSIIGIFLILSAMSYDMYTSMAGKLEVLAKSVIESNFQLLNHYESNIDSTVIPMLYNVKFSEDFQKNMNEFLRIIELMLKEYTVDTETYVKYIDYALVDESGKVYKKYSNTLAPLNLSKNILHEINKLEINEIRSFEIFSWNVVKNEKLFERLYFHRLSSNKFVVLRLFITAEPIEKSLKTFVDNLDISYTSFISLIDIYDLQNRKFFLTNKNFFDMRIVSMISEEGNDFKKLSLFRFPYIYAAIPIEIGRKDTGGVLYLIMIFNTSTVVLRFIAIFIVIIVSIAIIFYHLRNSMGNMAKSIIGCINNLIDKIELFKETKILETNEEELCAKDLSKVSEIKSLLDNFSDMASDITSFIEEMKDLNKFLGKTVAELEEKNREIERIHITFSQKLAMIAEGYDENTGNHIFRVGELSAFLAEKLNMNSEFVKNIKYYAQLHDIGKIMIPREILNKPDKLTEAEYEEMKKHTIYGAQILSGIEKFEMAHNIALYHHEKYDGTGYPFGLIGDEIPIEAQIVAIVDVYDALRSERSYKKAFSHEKSVEIITKGDGRTSPEEFNPALLEIFLEFEENIKALWEEVNDKGNSKREEEEEDVVN